MVRDEIRRLQKSNLIFRRNKKEDDFFTKEFNEDERNWYEKF